MKNALTTAALATFLSIGAFGAASAMPAAAPATGAATGTHRSNSSIIAVPAPIAAITVSCRGM